MKEKIRFYIGRFLRLINRFAPYLEIALVFYCVRSVAENQLSDKWYSVFLYIIPVFLLYRVLKWEFTCFKSVDIVKNTAYNRRVQGFQGPQGAGKTSFMLFSMYVLKAPEYYTNFPCKIRGKWCAKLDEAVINMDEKIPVNSVCAMSESTMFYHNLLSDIKKADEVREKLYPQQLHQQIIRHTYDGNFFYDSVDLTRLPQLLRENISMTNYMLGQGSVTLSYIITPILKMLGKLVGVDLRGSIRYWDVQQLERIPEQGYCFDLSTQEKTTDDKHFANLVRLSCWDSIYRFEYDDRFLRGLYDKLPEHVQSYWNSIQFLPEELREIGYGQILDWFEKKYKQAARSRRGK